jgi:lysophosphatidate acyltransferase
VLPPIHTTGLTAEDVAQLAERTRESMLATLRDISVIVPSDVRESTPQPSTVSRTPPPPAPESDSIVDVREILPEGKSMQPEEIPAAMHRSVTGSESEATDEDLVVVDRP